MWHNSPLRRGTIQFWGMDHEFLNASSCQHWKNLKGLRGIQCSAEVSLHIPTLCNEDWSATRRWQPCAWWGARGFPHPARAGRFIPASRYKTATIYHRAKYLLMWEREALRSGDSELERLLYAGDTRARFCARVGENPQSWMETVLHALCGAVYMQFAIHCCKSTKIQKSHVWDSAYCKVKYSK